ncbi:alpha-L-arabinofuranosidase C-terminal domain-containing protein [Flavobacterium sp. ZS1P14]|uniref:alpha-L-arabinofuranosidase C-terminal domain-containing protein n=1 Tax=Flavobacterium sp. ZS1P14 TaxID=3401729 RepID=UPI003AAAE008
MKKVKDLIIRVSKKANNKKRILMLLLIFFTGQLSSSIWAKEPDSVYLFAYTKQDGKRANGLMFAWSTDGKKWNTIGSEYRYLKSDYGRDKTLIQPFLLRDEQGIWHCFWTLNEREGLLAHTTSEDLVKWKSQSYNKMLSNDNCLSIEAVKKGNRYDVSWISKLSGKEKTYSVTTQDFKNFSGVKEITSRANTNLRNTININGENATGTVHKVKWNVVDRLMKAQQMVAYKGILNGESTHDDATRFSSLKQLEVKVNLNSSESKSISDLLIGVFFEDLNYAADGGLYAELIQNRDFEYVLSDKEGKDKDWNSRKAWELKGKGASWEIDSILPVHPNNKHYAKLKLESPDAALVSEGFDGIPLKAGDKYNFSLFSKIQEGKGGQVLIRLVDKEGKVCGEETLNCTSTNWKKQEIILTATQTVVDAKLEIYPRFQGTVAMDMISLFPQKTFKDRKNGLRADLAQTISDLKPKFMRFPGGCLSHGDGLNNMYRWKNTIGPLEARVPQRNIWDYHQTVGLGYFEYFQFCEDIGAQPLPVVAAGVPCQNSNGGQQGGIPMEQMGEYVQEVLDLIEWANGGVNTKWGKIRSESGHPKPFNLKYIGVGNEDMITDVFEERFTMIYKAIKEKYPEITVIGTSGPFLEGTDYEEGWQIADKLGLSMIDEHGYQSVGWYINNQDFYDSYDRNKAKVYLGEYAARAKGGPNLESALAEAFHLANIERNGDVVAMTSYAPLLAKEKFTQWNPDMIYFNNTEVKPTVGYYVQQLFGQNAGDTYIPTSLDLSDRSEAVKKRIVVSVVHDKASGDYIVKLVNLLPVSVKAKLDLSPLGQLETKVSYTCLSGRPEDKQLRPVTKSISLSEVMEKEIPAYSFSVLRFKNAK